MTSMDLLTLDPEEMRSLGYAVVDAVIEHLTTLGDRPVASIPTRAHMESLLREAIPEDPTPPLEVLARVRTAIIPNLTAVDHPRFFAYVPGPGNFVGAMADALAAGLNPFVGSWMGASAATATELVVIDWLREAVGMPAGAGGLFVSGGSMANLTALAAARHAMLEDRNDRAVIYASDQTHSAVERGARVLGFSHDQVRILPSDDRFRLDMRTLHEAIARDRAEGARPFCVVANAGTTNTGAVDPLEAIADLCAAEGLWMHVDGAYGAASALCERGRSALPGLGRADSVTLDPHKWLFQPFECGCIVMRDAHLLRETFRAVPAYLRDSDFSTEEVNFRDWGVQLTRGFRALKLWMSLQTFGAGHFRTAITHGIELAEHAERTLRADPAWEIVTPAQLGVVTFRRLVAGADEEAADAVQRMATERLTASGYAMLSTTALAGRTVLRLCTINPRTTFEEIDTTIAMLARFADDR